ncbi:MAG: indole-3-glycerol-phosphate synthase [Candidatus Ranarchaeia archaeon]
MPDYLDKLAKTTLETIKEGYYKKVENCTKQKISLRQKILESNKIPIISEIKASSPSKGKIRKIKDPNKLISEMEKGGAIGISILTEPKHFNGKLNTITKVRDKTNIPILMKDFFLTEQQIETAQKIGADAILLIQALFDRGYSTKTVPEMIKIAHEKNLEVLLEIHTEKEYLSATQTKADMIGINNRDLRTLEVNLETTKQILRKYKTQNKVIVSESGFKNKQDILDVKNYGAHCFLIGTTLMESKNIEQTIKKMVNNE